MKKDFLAVFNDVNSFSIPLILNSVFNLLISIVMTSIVGRISVNAIVSTEIIDTLNYAILGIAGVGTLVFNMESSKVRLKDEEGYYNWFKSCYLINGAVGLVIIATVYLLSESIFHSIYEIKDEKLGIVCMYAYISSFSIFANMLIFSMSNLLKVNKKTGYIFLSGALASILQIALAYLSVYKVLEENYKILGVGISSTVAVFFQLAVYLYILRKDIKKSLTVKSTKKKELVLKSIPLMFQEILEGSVFSVLIITLITRLGEDVISAYSISMKITALCLLPMYMYCNSLTVLVGEYSSGHEYAKMKILPVITTSLTISAYLIIAIFSLVFRENIVGILTDIDSVKIGTMNILKTVLIFSAFQILFENGKYAMQSIGKSRKVLCITIIINTFASAFLLIPAFYESLNLTIILSTLAFNYLILSIFFFGGYSSELSKL